MGLATVCIGLIPTYAAVGIWAPILLILCRLAQGIGLGGEWGGAVLMNKTFEDILASALRIARARRHQVLTPEHVVYALAGDEKSRAVIQAWGGSAAVLQMRMTSARPSASGCRAKRCARNCRVCGRPWRCCPANSRGLPAGLIRSGGRAGLDRCRWRIFMPSSPG